MAASSLVLGYHDCDTRYQQLLSTLDHKRRGVSDDVLKASELKYVLYKTIVHVLWGFEVVNGIEPF